MSLNALLQNLRRELNEPCARFPQSLVPNCHYHCRISASFMVLVLLPSPNIELNAITSCCIDVMSLAFIWELVRAHFTTARIQSKHDHKNQSHENELRWKEWSTYPRARCNLFNRLDKMKEFGMNLDRNLVGLSTNLQPFSLINFFYSIRWKLHKNSFSTLWRMIQFKRFKSWTEDVT